jgi:hypothetical protein
VSGCRCVSASGDRSCRKCEFQIRNCKNWNIRRGPAQLASDRRDSAPSTLRIFDRHRSFKFHHIFITYAHKPVASHVAAGPWAPGLPEPTQARPSVTLTARGEGRVILTLPGGTRSPWRATHRPPPQGPPAPCWAHASHCAQGAARPCGLEAEFEAEFNSRRSRRASPARRGGSSSPTRCRTTRRA